jgi:hypothetical protein
LQVPPAVLDTESIQGVRINDLYAAVEPHVETLQTRNNVHFEKEGSEFLGRKAAESVASALRLPAIAAEISSTPRP